MNHIRVSVAMAVYNGEKYISEQIDSILSQLSAEDELVISYDPSKDNTLRIIEAYAQCDSRVRVLKNSDPGVQNNFNNAVMACRGQYIFLSDQDDVWLDGKVETLLDTFEKTGADLVAHDAHIVDGSLNKTGTTIHEQTGTATGWVRNIIKGTYWGCCMAFRAQLREKACPFPSKNAVGHDIWIGILADMFGKVTRIDDCLILHRIHGSNVTTSRRKLNVVIRHRAALIWYLIKRVLCNH